MKRPVKLGIASLKALGTVVVLGAVAHAGLPYLPLIGPPPLRLLAARPPGAAVLKLKLAAPRAATSTNLPATVATVAAVVPAAFPGVTNATSSDTPAFAGPLIRAGADPSQKSLEDTFTSSVFALPTPDLLGITPQMLATYFHPVQFGTNAALAGQFHVGFMPPLPAPVPDKSSHAEYIVK